MKLVQKTLVATTLLAATAVASAAESSVSANVGVTTDYRFRGVSQSAQDPALQGGVDYTGSTGFYVGVWGSTIDFEAPGADPDANIEVDLYGGYKWTAAGIDWDVGLIYYAYPGSESSFDLDFTEVYVGGAYGPFSAKYYYTNDFTGPTSDSAYYLTAGLNFELADGYTLGLSVGKSDGDAFSGGLDYVDYKIGVSKEFAGFGFNLSYVDTDIDPEVTTDVFNSEGKVVLTVTKSF